MIIRPVEPADYGELGALTLDAYTSLDGHVHEPDYEVELADVRSRAEAPATLVLVAVDDDGRLIGGVTYAIDHTSPFAEGTPEDGASFRMLAVAPSSQGRGTGKALVHACIARANQDGKTALVLHTTPWMTTAHRLYEGLGFARDSERDWQATPQVLLLGYRLDLVP
ncbi:MAG TPA: GNAT family N-acetyltransferase [Acidimicrobiales bacterium]|nr:GNAT family N-acetyltransferase [Acidimicrobiales bacterium]